MNTTAETTIEAHPTLPIITMTRDFAATPEQLFRAHTDPEIFRRWVGPDSTSTTIDYWDARTGGSWRFVGTNDGQEYGFHGSFHEVGPTRIVQTFTWEGMPEGVSLETLRFEDLGDGRTRLTPSRSSRASRTATPGCAAAWRSASTTATPSSTGCSPTTPSDVLRARRSE